MSDDMNIRVGPNHEHCTECGEANDGYDEIVHRASCSHAPKDKRSKAHPTVVSEDELPPALRRLRSAFREGR